MRVAFLLIIGLLAGCVPKEKRLLAEYQAAHIKDVVAYTGEDAALAFREKSAFIERVKALEAQGAPIPVADILVWETARLGLLSEHLGRREDAARFFRLAAEYAQKAYPDRPESEKSEAALRSALEKMDTPENFPWRKK